MTIHRFRTTATIARRPSHGRTAVRVGALAASAAVALGACSGGESSEESTPEASFSAVAAKEWTVDTSGWWVPEDPTGCLTETTTCPMSAWPTREYKEGQIAINVFRHGDALTLFCKAPTPVAIRNSIETEAVYWYYAQQGENYWWIPDIYVTKDDTAGMADGVPDCPSNTPGVNGGPVPSQSTPSQSPPVTPS